MCSSHAAGNLDPQRGNRFFFGAAGFLGAIPDFTLRSQFNIAAIEDNDMQARVIVLANEIADAEAETETV